MLEAEYLWGQVTLCSVKGMVLPAWQWVKTRAGQGLGAGLNDIEHTKLGIM